MVPQQRPRLQTVFKKNLVILLQALQRTTPVVTELRVPGQKLSFSISAKTSLA